ncbi:MAG: DUF4430 domain-containing protein [Sarcina sp.]
MNNKNKKIFLVTTFICILFAISFSILNIDISQAEKSNSYSSKIDLNEEQDSTSTNAEENENISSTKPSADKQNNSNITIKPNVTLDKPSNSKPNINSSSSQETSNQISNNDNISSNTSSSLTQTENSNEYIYVSLKGANNSHIGDYKIKSTKIMSAFNATKEAFDLNSIEMLSRGSGMTKYVFSINGLSEFDYGGSSGWMYKVNGSFPNKSCGIFDVNPSDKIEWVYTIDGGKDVGAR